MASTAVLPRWQQRASSAGSLGWRRPLAVALPLYFCFRWRARRIFLQALAEQFDPTRGRGVVVVGSFKDAGWRSRGVWAAAIVGRPRHRVEGPVSRRARAIL
jgi:hypothetical protein